ncbi:Probable hemoglobin and hemoglobin-haptoglobin-binding protein 1 precursor [Moraxella catarrhalis]|nr:Probable hemoglobin and hemoglobin-haptoglobin-binding protein 1 precursor [Moraxella catarrhalis]
MIQNAQTHANDDAKHKLPEIQLEAETVITTATPKIIGQTVVDDETLSRNMVSDGRDLVRHETGITVVEAGRFGTSGYAIRGVDENRVAVMIDGLRQAETLASQGFKELFEGMVILIIPEIVLSLKMSKKPPSKKVLILSQQAAVL